MEKTTKEEAMKLTATEVTDFRTRIIAHLSQTEIEKVDRLLDANR